MTNEKLKTLLKLVIEALMPNLDSYRKPLRKGRVVQTYSSDGRYVCDIEILLNNNQPDESEPVVKSVEIPVIWGGKNRGVVCPPAVGTYCDVEYYHGDPDYPRISNFRSFGNGAAATDIDEFIIQQDNNVFIHIKQNGEIVIKGDVEVSIDGGSSDLTGVVTRSCICPITMAPHIEYSKNVSASKGG